MEPLTALVLGTLAVGLTLVIFWPRWGVLARARRSRQISTRMSAEDGLKHLYKEELRGRRATLQSLAGSLQVSLNRAAGVVEDLQERELLASSGAEIRLNAEGRRYAVSVIRAHRIWEQHLAQETGVAESEWHARAELQEHFLSPEQTENLAARLGHPTHDPHGDPIPTAGGELTSRPYKSVAAIQAGEVARIVHIEDEPEEVYAQILAAELYPGMVVRVTENTPRRVRLWADGEERVLAPVVASNVSVVRLEETVEDEAGERHSLSQSALREPVRVKRLSPRCRGAERRRLMDLGILPGTEVIPEMVSGSGNLRAYRVRDALIALRREQTDLIEVYGGEASAIRGPQVAQKVSV